MPLSFTADLHAELLLPDGRVPLALQRALAGEYGELLELPLPDGTVNRVVLPARVLSGLLVTSDKAILVCVGDVTQNQPVALSAGGVFAVLGSEVVAVHACALSYTPGDGSVATCAVLALMQARALTGCARFAEHPTLAQGLAHCWELDEETGARADHVGALTLVESGTVTTSVPGKIGRAAVFAGTNWLTPTPYPLFPLFEPPFTLAFWMSIDAYPVTESWCLAAQGYSLSPNNSWFHVLISPSNHLLQMFVRQGFGGVLYSVAPVPLGGWHLVVVGAEYINVSGYREIASFIQIDNGALATIVANEAAASQVFSRPQIGAIGDATTSSRYRGRLDQLVHWTRALTSQAERDAIWNAGHG